MRKEVKEIRVGFSYQAEQVRAQQIFHPLRKFLRGDALDYGCCHGAFLEQLKKYGCNAVGADIDDGYVEWCRSRGFDVVKIKPGQSLPFDDRSFDLVIASHVMEHVDAPWNLMHDFHRVLKVDGTLIVILPNAANIRAESSFAIGHLHYYDPVTLYFAVRAAGFTPRMIKSDLPLASRVGNRFNGFALPLAPGNWASRWQRAILRALPNFHVGLNLFCVARRSSTAGPLGVEDAKTLPTGTSTGKTSTG